MNNSVTNTHQELLFNKSHLPITKVQKEGHEYTYIQHPWKWQATRFFQALAMTILTLGIGLCFSFVRERWNEAFTGKEVKIEKSSKEKNQNVSVITDQNKADLNKKSKNENDKEINQKNQNIDQNANDSKQNQIPNTSQEISHSPKNHLGSSELEELLSSTTKEKALKEILEKGVVLSSGDANSLLKNVLNEAWLTPDHISAFENVTELDFSNVSYPISVKLLDSILSKCKKIQNIKGYIQKQEYPHTTIINISTPSQLLDYFLSEKSVPFQFIQMPESEFLHTLKLPILKKIIELAYEKDENIMDKIFEKIIEEISIDEPKAVKKYSFDSLISKLVKCEFNDKLLFSLFNQKCNLIKKHVFKNGQDEQCQALINTTKSISSLKTVSYTSKTYELVEVNLRTVGMIQLIPYLFLGGDIVHAYAKTVNLLKGETDEILKEIVDYYVNSLHGDLVNFETSALFLYTLIKDFDLISNDLLHSIKQSFSKAKQSFSNAYFSTVIAEHCEDKVFHSLFSNLIKYYSSTEITYVFMSQFVEQILKQNDAEKIKVVFNELLPVIQYLELGEPKFKNLIDANPSLIGANDLEKQKQFLNQFLSILDDIEYSP